MVLNCATFLMLFVHRPDTLKSTVDHSQQTTLFSIVPCSINFTITPAVRLIRDELKHVIAEKRLRLINAKVISESEWPEVTSIKSLI